MMMKFRGEVKAEMNQRVKGLVHALVAALWSLVILFPTRRHWRFSLKNEQKRPLFSRCGKSQRPVSVATR